MTNTLADALKPGDLADALEHARRIKGDQFCIDGETLRAASSYIRRHATQPTGAAREAAILVVDGVCEAVKIATGLPMNKASREATYDATAEILAPYISHDARGQALEGERARIAGMEEEIARALYLYDRPTMATLKDASLPWEELSKFGRDIYINKARAVIAALQARSQGRQE